MHLKNIIHVKVLETMRKSLSSVCTRVRSYHRYARIIIIIVVIIIYAETAFIRRRGALKLPETDTHKSKYNGPENFINAVRSSILAWRAAKKKNYKHCVAPRYIYPGAAPRRALWHRFKNFNVDVVTARR